MPWTYNPSEAMECLPVGDYDAELTTVIEKTSKAGNPMLEVTWSIMHNGKVWPVRDYIVNPGTLYKLKGIARAWQMMQDFESGTFDLQEHVGAIIRVSLRVESSDVYGDKNQIQGYRPTSLDAGHKIIKREPEPVEKDVEIPF